MPRVNRDLQRRLAQRRERERRRPSTERRYRFATTEPDLAPEEQVLEAELEAEAAAPAPRPAPARRPPARNGAATHAPAIPGSFSSFGTEYAYVLTDLKRIALVVGSILAVLIILYFVLPH